MKVKQSIYTKIIVSLLSVLLIIPVIPISPSYAAENSLNDHYTTYFTDRYEQLEDADHVYRTLTYHELDFLLKSDGTYVVLVGGAWSKDTQAVIGYINEVAKELNIPTIHQFDTRLDGKSIDIADSQFNPFSRRYVELVNQHLTNLSDHVEGIDQVEFSDAVTSGRAPNQVTRTIEGIAPKLEVPFLFVYNKDHQENGNSAPIVASLEQISALLTDGEIDPSKADDYKAQVRAVLEATAGQVDTLQNNDYIASSYNEFAGTTIFDESDLDIVLDPVTYDELLQILDSEGNYVFLFGCSWCPNTRAIAKLVNQYAKDYQIDAVYNWDTKLDGGIGGTPGVEAGTDSANLLQTRTTGHPFAHVYVDLIDQYFPNIETLYDIAKDNVSYTDASGEEIVVNKLQVPYVFVYNKDHKDANGNAAPILGHVELMYSWANIQPDYERGGKAGVNYNIYTAELDRLFSNLAGLAPQAAPTGIAGIAPQTAVSQDGEIRGTSNELEYKRAEELNYQPITDTSVTGLAHGTYYIRYAAKEGAQPSPAVILDLNLGQEAPVGLEGRAPTTAANEDGVIKGASAGLEFRAEGAANFTAATGEEIKGLSPGTYSVRTAAVYGFNASNEVEVVVPAYTPTTFGDVTADAWYYEAISYLADQGIAAGLDATSFAPETNITKGQYVNWIVKGLPSKDVAAPQEVAQQIGLIDSSSAGTAWQEETITREQLVVSAYNAAQAINQLPEAIEGSTLASFSDASSLAADALEAWGTLVEGGIISGYASKLNPNDVATRAQAADRKSVV